jgi:hypothetical protein
MTVGDLEVLEGVNGKDDIVKDMLIRSRVSITGKAVPIFKVRSEL